MRNAVALKLAAVLLVAATALPASSAPAASPPTAVASPYAVDTVRACDLPDFLAKLHKQGFTVVSVFPASALETESEDFCPCQRGVHCFPAPGWHVWTVQVVSKWSPPSSDVGTDR